MAFNLDLGVVRLTSATIRIVAERNAPLSVEIRGLGVALSIPGVLEGSGTARINPDGSVAATLDVNVVAAGLLAQAELELKPELAYVAICVRVILPVGIPLANTGLGIFGFVGQFVSNGERTFAMGRLGHAHRARHGERQRPHRSCALDQRARSAGEHR